MKIIIVGASGRIGKEVDKAGLDKALAAFAQADKTAARLELVAARIDKSKDEPVLIADAIISLDVILPELVAEIRISAASIAWDEMTLARLKTMSQGGNARLAFHVRLPDASLAQLITGPCMRWEEAVKVQLDARFSSESVTVFCKPWQPPRKQQVRWDKRGI